MAWHGIAQHSNTTQYNQFGHFLLYAPICQFSLFTEDKVIIKYYDNIHIYSIPVK